VLEFSARTVGTSHRAAALKHRSQPEYDADKREKCTAEHLAEAFEIAGLRRAMCPDAHRLSRQADSAILLADSNRGYR
jgi:hypothetical protein